MNKKFTLLFDLLIVLLIPAGVAFAQYVPGPYLPGQTLDPDCQPNEENCSVDINDAIELRFDGSVLDTDVSIINFQGSDISASSDEAGIVGINVGDSFMVKSNGAILTEDAKSLEFTNGIVIANNGDDIFVEAAITDVWNEGSLVDDTPGIFDFIGGGIEAVVDAGDSRKVNINVPGLSFLNSGVNVTSDAVTTLNIGGDNAEVIYQGGGVLDLNVYEGLELIDENNTPYASTYLTIFDSNLLVGPNAVGAGSLAIGPGVAATGEGSVAIGPNTLAIGKESMAIGAGSYAVGENSVALGLLNVSNAFAEVTVGAHNRSIDVFSGSTFDERDRAFSVGVAEAGGLSNGMNGFTVYKNEAVEAGDTSRAFSPGSFAGGKYSITHNQSFLTLPLVDFGENYVVIEGDITDLYGGFTLGRLINEDLNSAYASTNMDQVTIDVDGNTRIGMSGLTNTTILDTSVEDISIMLLGIQEPNTGDRNGEIAYGNYAFATGKAAAAVGGYAASAAGEGSFATGYRSTSLGDWSQAFGVGVRADSYGEFVVGNYNTAYDPVSRTLTSSSDRVFTVGNGAINSDRSDALTILKNGNIGIGVDNFEANNPDGHAILHSSGAHLTSTGDWVSVSDASRKENISDIPYGLDAVLQLEPRVFNYKSDGSKGIGFVAQELEQIIPEAVSGSEGTKGIRYGQMTAVLVEAVQELAAIVGAEEAARLLEGELTDANGGAEVKIITAEQICLGETCLTEDQLKSLLDGSKEIRTSTSNSQELIDRINILQQLRDRRSDDTGDQKASALDSVSGLGLGDLILKILF